MDAACQASARDGAWRLCVMGTAEGTAMPTWSHHPPSRPSHHSDAACMHASGRVARLSLSETSGWLRRAAPLCSKSGVSQPRGQRSEAQVHAERALPTRRRHLTRRNIDKKIGWDVDGCCCASFIMGDAFAKFATKPD